MGEYLELLVEKHKAEYKPGNYRGYVELLMYMLTHGITEPMRAMNEVGITWDDFYSRFENYPEFIKVDWGSPEEIVEFIVKNDVKYYLTLLDAGNDKIKNFKISFPEGAKELVDAYNNSVHRGDDFY